MYNDILTIGGITIHGYGLMIGVGIICAIFLAHYRAKKRGLNVDALFSIMLLLLIFGFVGAKLVYVVTDLKSVLANPILIVTGSGFVVYGGIIGGVAAMMVYCRVKKISFLTYLDLLAPSVAVAQGFGRIGCFLAGCCYGRETDSAFSIIFQKSLYAPNGVKLLPTQLMMSAGDFIIAAILLLYAKKDRRKGKTGGLYLILYSAGRFAVEFFRNDVRGSVGFLSTSQFISIFTLILGVLLFATNIFSRKKPASSDNEDM